MLKNKTNQLKKVILVISGTIAAPKSMILYRLLKKEGYHVSLIKSANTNYFLNSSDQKIQAKNKIFDSNQFYDKTLPIWHTDLNQNYDLMVVYSASANFLAKINAGISDDAPSLAFLSFNQMKYVFPAMNDKMWLNPITQRNIQQLKIIKNMRLFAPQIGYLACDREKKLVGRAWEPRTVLQKINLFFTKTRKPKKARTRKKLTD